VDEEHPLKDLGSEVIVVLRVGRHGKLVLRVVAERNGRKIRKI
jgi:hypothetical protein